MATAAPIPDPQQLKDYVFNTAGFSFQHPFVNRQELLVINGLGAPSTKSTGSVLPNMPQKDLATCTTMLATNAELDSSSRTKHKYLVVGLTPLNLWKSKKIGKDKGNALGVKAPLTSKLINHNGEFLRVVLHVTEKDAVSKKLSVLVERDHTSDLCKAFEFNVEQTFFFSEFRSAETTRPKRKSNWFQLARNFAYTNETDDHDKREGRRTAKARSYPTIPATLNRNAANELRLLTNLLEKGSNKKETLDQIQGLLRAIEGLGLHDVTMLERFADCSDKHAEFGESEANAAIKEALKLWPELERLNMQAEIMVAMKKSLERLAEKEGPENEKVQLEFRHIKGLLAFTFARWPKSFIATEFQMDEGMSIAIESVRIIVGDVPDDRVLPRHTWGDDTWRSIIGATVSKLKEISNAFKAAAGELNRFSGSRHTDGHMEDIIEAYTKALDVGSARLLFDEAVNASSEKWAQKLQVLAAPLDEIIAQLETLLV